MDGNPFYRPCPRCHKLRQRANDAWSEIQAHLDAMPAMVRPTITNPPQFNCTQCNDKGAILTDPAKEFKDAILAELDAKWRKERSNGKA